MKWLMSPILWGGLLILGGVLLLLQNLGLIQFEGILWAIFFGLSGVLFLTIFFSHRDNWWALIPAGALLSLAAAIGVGNYLDSNAIGGIFLIGFGLTFAITAFVRTPNGRLWWAWIPAAILTILGLIMSATSGDLIVYLWPAALILAGLLILYYTLRSKSR